MPEYYRQFSYSLNVRSAENGERAMEIFHNMRLEYRFTESGSFYS